LAAQDRELVPLSWGEQGQDLLRDTRELLLGTIQEFLAEVAMCAPLLDPGLHRASEGIKELALIRLNPLENLFDTLPLAGLEVQFGLDFRIRNHTHNAAAVSTG
jgi:hypothetical protein